MSQCSFCGSAEDKHAPLCQSCGALRYPVAINCSSHAISSHDKLKYSAIAAATVITPGSLVLLAFLGVSRLGSKKKI